MPQNLPSLNKIWMHAWIMKSEGMVRRDSKKKLHYDPRVYPACITEDRGAQSSAPGQNRTADARKRHLKQIPKRKDGNVEVG